MVSKPALGKLEDVNLHEYWKDKSQDFTPWLATEKNIQLLGQAIGLKLEIETQGKNVGLFKPDILCKETTKDKWVVIENQLEPADHTHFGQLLTYAAGLNAATVIWIAREFTPEHRVALDWLNRVTDKRVNFFGIQIELWRIGESSPAPRFNLIAKPNNWPKTTEDAAREDRPTNGRRKRLQFWIAFKKYMEANSKIQCQEPAPQQWMNHSIGRSECYLTSVVSAWDNQGNLYGTGEIRVELVLGDVNADIYFAQLKSQEKKIAEEVRQTLTWHNPSDSRERKIYVRRFAEVDNESKWPEYQVWIWEKLESFYRVFAPRVKALSDDANVS